METLRAKLLEDYLSEDEMAAELNRDVRTLKRWRTLRKGPPVTWVGKTPKYHIQSARKWLQANEQPMPRRGARR
jgi:hypothetical protein